MANIGEKYVYRTNGVCTLSAEEVRNGTQFYKLIPIFDPSAAIFVPIDRAPLRSPLTRAQAEDLLDSVSEMKSDWINDSKERRRVYGQILSDSSIFDITVMLKSLYSKKMERHRAGKYMYSYEENLLQNAMRSVCGELAYSLGVSRQEAVTMLEAKMAV